MDSVHSTYLFTTVGTLSVTSVDCVWHPLWMTHTVEVWLVLIWKLIKEDLEIALPYWITKPWIMPCLIVYYFALPSYRCPILTNQFLVAVFLRCCTQKNESCYAKLCTSLPYHHLGAPFLPISFLLQYSCLQKFVYYKHLCFYRFSVSIGDCISEKWAPRFCTFSLCYALWM